MTELFDDKFFQVSARLKAGLKSQEIRTISELDQHQFVPNDREVLKKETKMTNTSGFYVNPLYEKIPLQSCRTLDSMMGGGIPTRQVTELAGAPGTGKTQICMQLSVSFLAHFGGEGSCVYIDSEGSFMAERVAEIARSYVNEFSSSSSDKIEENVEYHLRHIHVFRVHSKDDFGSVMNILEDFVKKNNVKVIIIDSIAAIFRSSGDSKLHDYKEMLSGIGSRYDVATVITNQLVTSKNRGDYIPALGEKWSHGLNHRVLLSWKRNMRIAELVKSTGADPTKEYPYRVTLGGIKDIDDFNNDILPTSKNPVKESRVNHSSDIGEAPLLKKARVM
eukprot:TRINITY_DN776004_c0_g1_i1.p1 TRINITY_DN776004_c0_g1~~TRINITY_DN776004_c0_g1_i1.p1  ORF type:complete len:334 (+),score=79.57 TRINITY_DN776004_c0_g1_i1:114-1115(+)